MTQAHKNKDFTFKTYSPVAFRFFREAFQIKPDDYLVRERDRERDREREGEREKERWGGRKGERGRER